MGVKKHKDTHPVIRFLLTESRLNRIQISEKLGISLKGLVAWENGSVYIAEYMLDDLSAAAGVSLDRIPLHLKKRGEEIRDARILKRTTTSNGKTASAGCDCDHRDPQLLILVGLVVRGLRGR